MADVRTSSGGGRVVLLSSDPSLTAAAWNDNGSVELVVARGAYEAAAEILSAPAAALVIDLRLLSPRHARLLEIARRLDLEMLAVGALPVSMSSEDLSGIRLVSRRDLPAALATAARPRPQMAPIQAEAPRDQAPAARAMPAIEIPAGRPAPRKPFGPDTSVQRPGHVDEPTEGPPVAYSEGALPTEAAPAPDEVDADAEAEAEASDDDLSTVDPPPIIAEALRQVASRRTTEERGEARSQHDAEQPDAPAEPAPEKPRRAAGKAAKDPGRPEALLTPEEIDALLGNER